MIFTIICPGFPDPISAGGRTIITAPELAETAEQKFRDIGEIFTSDLLRELSNPPSFRWRMGLSKSEESAKTVKGRAAAVAKMILQRDSPGIVFAPPLFLPFLLRALERQGCNIRRSQSGAIRPGERIRVSEKKDHCGGCQHNCLLTNPGCGVGKDKASRGY